MLAKLATLTADQKKKKWKSHTILSVNYHTGFYRYHSTGELSFPVNMNTVSKTGAVYILKVVSIFSFK